MENIQSVYYIADRIYSGTPLYGTMLETGNSGAVPISDKASNEVAVADCQTKT